MSFQPDHKKFRRLHKHYFAQEPTKVQDALYASYPLGCGYDDCDKDPARFRAVLTVALVLAIPPDGNLSNVQTVYMFFPKSYERWVVGEIRTCAESIFGRLRVEQRVDAARFVGECFKALRLGHRVMEIPEAPERWVSFGFARKGPVPAWLSDKLSAT